MSVLLGTLHEWAPAINVSCISNSTGTNAGFKPRMFWGVVAYKAAKVPILRDTV